MDLIDILLATRNSRVALNSIPYLYIVKYIESLNRILLLFVY